VLQSLVLIGRALVCLSVCPAQLSREEDTQFRSSFTEDSGARKVISGERTSKFMTISATRPDIVVRRIVQKAANCMGFFNDNVEPLQVVRYSRGQYFNSHHDAGTLNDEDGCIEPVAPRRILTFFVYLNDCPAGEGHTAFPAVRRGREFAGVATVEAPHVPNVRPSSSSDCAAVRRPETAEAKRCLSPQPAVSSGSPCRLLPPRSPLTPQQVRRLARQGGVKPCCPPTPTAWEEAAAAAAKAEESGAASNDPLSEILSVQPKAGCALLFCNFYIPPLHATDTDTDTDAESTSESVSESATGGGDSGPAVAVGSSSSGVSVSGESRRQSAVQYVESDSALYPLLPGRPDPRTIHSATPVLSRGVTKYGMNIWVTDEHAFSHTGDGGRSHAGKGKGRGKGDKVQVAAGAGAAGAGAAVGEPRRKRGRPPKRQHAQTFVSNHGE
jgi:hypothetical protein